MMLKNRVRHYIKKNKITAGKLADLVGIHRSSLHRFLTDDKAGINYTTAEKLITYMTMNP